MKQNTGFATLAIGAAFLSFALVFLQLQVAGLILGIIAIVVGGLGLLLAVSYRLSDRNQSVASILLGLTATALALVVLLV